MKAQSNRTKDNQCGSCDAGFWLDGDTCKSRTTSCDAGFFVHASNNARVDNTCKPWGGECANGTLKAQSERTADDQCGSCDAGYTLADNACNNPCDVPHAKAYSDGCTVSECDAGYKLDGNACTPWSGGCEGGMLKAQSERTADDQCGSCDPGFRLEEDTCNPCGAAHATVYSEGCTVYQCAAKYKLEDNACKSWGGVCANGTLKSEDERTADGQCGSCDPGYLSLIHISEPTRPY